jgi:hypothetical protein
MTPFGLILAAALSAASAAQAPVQVQAQAFELDQYLGRWGGAAPRPEEEQQRREMNAQAKPRPLIGKTFIIRKGGQNRDTRPAAEVTSGSDGKFKVALAPGTWCVVEESKRYVDPSKAFGVAATPSANTDEACMRQMRSQCDAVWKVAAAPAEQSVSVTLTRKQGGAPPCWRGSSPPSAAPKR